MIRVKADTADYVRAMRIFGRRHMPDAVAYSLNSAANAVRDRSKKNVNSRLTVRTKYTVNSIRTTNQARGNNIGRMFSRAGSMSDYLGIHDEGGKREATRDKIPSPTNAARVGGDYKRRIRKKYTMNNIDGAGGSIFLLRPSSPPSALKFPAFFYRKNKRTIIMVRALDADYYRIKPTHWFSDAVKKYGTQQYIEAKFMEAARRWLNQY